jgi:hypothetical protein
MKLHLALGSLAVFVVASVSACSSSSQSGTSECLPEPCPSNAQWNPSTCSCGPEESDGGKSECSPLPCPSNATWSPSTCSCVSEQGDAGVLDSAQTCSPPPSANTLEDGSTVGCSAGAAINICEVGPDGGQTCHDACSGSQYSLTCEGNAQAPASLTCTVVPIPTPNGVTEYCCECP